jgi:hypothetical protein
VTGLIAAICVTGFAQNNSPERHAHRPEAKLAPDAILPMPEDRAEDSYAIYSLLMPGKTLASLPSAQGAPWAIASVTVNETERNPQVPPQGQLKPPPDNPKGFSEALGDYEVNKYARVRLEKNEFHLDHAFALVDGDRAKSGDFPGVTYFSEVYFDSKHRAALVYQYEWCANLCAGGSWVYLEKHDGRWQRRSGIVVPGA